LEEIGNPECIPALIQALKDKDSEVRNYAASALGKFGETKSVPGLIQALKDDDTLVRSSAAEALGNIRCPESVPALIQALKDVDSEVRYDTITALRKIGTLDVLQKIITSPDVDIFDSDIHLLARALARRNYRENTDFIPVYPELVEKYKKNKNK
jgi:HEAT repeat protein